jgi:hypothetical protein
MKNRFLILGLFVPLSAAAVVLVLVSFRTAEPWRGLLVNVSAGLLGSMITVFYIDQIIRRNEAYEWKKVMRHVGRQVNFLANGTISSVRTALGMKVPSALKDPSLVNDMRGMRTAMIGLIENGLLPRLSELAEIDQDHWQIFAKNMQGALMDAERILSLFSKNLSPETMGLVLDVHEKARALLLQYQLWPDMLGVPLDRLRPNNRGESTVPLMMATYDRIVSEAAQLLTSCAALLRNIDAQFPN